MPSPPATQCFALIIGNDRNFSLENAERTCRSFPRVVLLRLLRFLLEELGNDVIYAPFLLLFLPLTPFFSHFIDNFAILPFSLPRLPLLAPIVNA